MSLKFCKQELDRFGRASKRRMSAAVSAIWCGLRICISPPDDWWEKTSSSDWRGCGVPRNCAERMTRKRPSRSLTQPTPRFHGARSGDARRSRRSLQAREAGAVLAVPNTGEVERLADIFTEYNVSFRLGSRTRGGESYADETVLLRGRSADGDAGESVCAGRRVVLPEAHLAIFGARDLV